MADIINNRTGISGSTLKIIAIATMLIDHIGAALLPGLMVLRYIGRLAFPIFCFLLAEGFLHTRNVKKYALRLLFFCFVSEVPFDLAIFGRPVYWGHQNVFFTLFIGLMVLAGLKYLEKPGILYQALKLVCILAGMAAAVYLRTDYDAFGILVIVFFYQFRNMALFRDIFVSLGLLLCSLTEITGLFALIPIHLYNGKRGLSLKYFFYLFYPVHLLLLYAFRLLFMAG